tara:strand:- start:113 stop:490 length:378 start_codon:yes stop_codon:yes gene_type:complete
MLNAIEVNQYRNLNNPAQSLWNALNKNVELLRTNFMSRSLKVPEGGYAAVVIYYHFLKQLGYSNDKIMSEANISNVVLEKVQKQLSHSLRGSPEYDRLNNRLQLVENFMRHEQLGYFYHNTTIRG